MSEEAKRERFERLMLPHLDAAYTLAFWLARDEDRAKDAVQEAYLRALRFFGSFRGEDGRPWLLKIVRHACYEMLDRERASAADQLDEEAQGADGTATGAVLVFPLGPEAAAIARARRELVHDSLRAMPHDYREVLVLRELHGCAYKEIAAIASIPIGTVMSRLARARRLLRTKIAGHVKREDTGT